MYFICLFLTFASFPWITVAFCIAFDLKLDPIILIIQRILPHNLALLQLYYYVIRPLYIIPLIQCSRSLCFAALMYGIEGNLAANCVDYLDKTVFRLKSHFRPRVEKYLRDYNTLRVCVTMISSSSGPLIWFGLTCVFIISVTSNYIWIRLRNEIPMYLVFPMVGIFAPITLLIMLSIIVVGNEKSKLILRKCKFNIHKNPEIKYVRRRIYAMQPFCVYGELMGIKLFKCNKSFRTEYFSAMLDNTVSAVMI